MGESADTRYGRVLESVHIAGYSFSRMQHELIWLLQEERWAEVGPGFEDVNVFLRSIDLSSWKIEDRPKLVRAIKAAQPQASNRAIAELAGVDEGTVRNDLRAENSAAGSEGSAETSGSGPVSAENSAPAFAGGEAAQKAAKKDADKKRKDAEREAERAELASTKAPLVGHRYELIPGDFTEDEVAVAVEDECADIILTDPPYDADAVAAYDQLSQFAASKLKPGGSAFVMVGQFHLGEALRQLSTALQYHWTLAYLTPGGQSPRAPMARSVNSFWKPVLWFTKGEYAGDFIGDVAQSRENDNDKRFHDWGQAESGVADLVARCSKEGELILDPYLGGGTIGQIAVEMNRRFVGIERDGVALATAAARIGALQEVA